MKTPEYYLKNSSNFGWNEKAVKVDSQRLMLLKKYLQGKKVLDIGCGSGIYTDYLSKEGYAATGMDFVKEFISLAKKHKLGNFTLGSADKLPFKDKEFDCSFLFDILEHGDDKKILKEAKRVTKKRILVIVPRVVDERLGNSGVIFRHYIDKSHLREYTQEMLKSLAKDCLLKVVTIEKIHPLYNETVFMALFNGPYLLKKIMRKILLFILPTEKYYTEYFAVFENK